MRALALAVAIAGCASGEDAELGCTFDGRYELGFLPTVGGCESVAQTFRFYDAFGECLATERGLNLEGVPYVYTISCAPGDPVVECEGWATYANGCEYEVYLRRLTAR